MASAPVLAYFVATTAGVVSNQRGDVQHHQMFSLNCKFWLNLALSAILVSALGLKCIEKSATSGLAAGFNENEFDHRNMTSGKRLHGS